MKETYKYNNKFIELKWNWKYVHKNDRRSIFFFKYSRKATKITLIET